MSALIYLAIPAFIVTVALEALLVTRARHHGANWVGYEPRDTAASLTMGIGNVLISLGTKLGWTAIWVVLYEHRLFDLPTDAWWVFALLLVAEDFCYYWFHRASHEVRFFWAAHVNHHSSQHYNLSTALRQSWTSPVVGGIFWLPLPLLGFHPALVLTQQAISLLYQYWIHIEWAGRLGPLEWVLNTPSHHRVHHGRNPRYLDRNHGGIFIIWDRLFGTFEAEAERPSYGLTTNIASYNPVVIAFHEWAAIGRDLRRARSVREALGALFGPPGWRADGTGETSARIRAKARAGTADGP
jgi:sterol desaturase/sphingolipid hydroxylase (fatty acid hydroxylase superfamily)